MTRATATPALDPRAAAPPPEYPLTLPALLGWSADRFGASECVVDGDQRHSFRDIERASARLASRLFEGGAGKGTRIGLLMPNGPDWVTSFFAITRIGAIAVPLSTFYSARELAWTLRHADVDTLLMSARYRGHDYVGRLEEAAPELARADGAPLFLPSLPYLRSVFVFDADPRWSRGGRPGQDDPIDDERLSAVEDCVTPADTAVVIHTSGSTSAPKGVLHTHGASVRHAHAVGRDFHSDLHPGDRLYTNQPFFWIGGLALCVLGSLEFGACLHCDAPLDPDGILDLVAKERITHVVALGHHTRALFAHPRLAEEDFSFVRFGMVRRRDANGDPVPPDRIANRLGMTETFGQHSLERTGEILAPEHSGSFGRGVPQIERRIVDPATRDPLPPGESGELEVRGYSLMQGFYKREREDTFEADGFYRTGDRCRIDADGHIYFEGRLDDLIKSRGVNVDPAEVEAAIEAFPGVRRAGVVGIAGPSGDVEIAAAVVPRPATALAVEDLRAHLRAALSTFKVPRSFFLMKAEELPLTASEKIRRPQLRELIELRASAEGATPASDPEANHASSRE